MLALIQRFDDQTQAHEDRVNVMSSLAGPPQGYSL